MKKKRFHFDFTLWAIYLMYFLFIAFIFFRFYLMFKYGDRPISETPVWVLYFLR